MEKLKPEKIFKIIPARKRNFSIIGERKTLGSNFPPPPAQTTRGLR